MNPSKDRFIPKRGLEANILASAPEKGHLWFALDTRKIFYSDGKDFIPMGGNSSIYYGTKNTSSADEEQIEFIFSPEELEDAESKGLPQVNDLILNSDGCFYRVKFVEDDQVEAVRLTIAGSGTGGGGSSNRGSATIDYVSPSRDVATRDGITLLENTPYSLTYKVTAKDSFGDEVLERSSVVWYKVTNGVKTKITTDSNIKPGENTFDVSEYLAPGTYQIRGEFKVWAGGDEPISVNRTWDFNIIRVELKWDYDISYTNMGSKFQLQWNVIGNVEKTTHILIDNGASIYEKTVTFTSNTTQTEYLSRAEYELNHGFAKITLYATCSVNGVSFETERITKEVMFVDPDSQEPIIVIGNYKEDMSQYNTQQIPIVVYNGSTAYLYDNDVLVDTWTDLNGNIRNWSFTPSAKGEHQLRITCGGQERSLLIQVAELDIDNEETPNWAFKLKASEFASNDALKSWRDNGVTVSFSDNFDWVNGGLQTEKDEKGNSRQFICIKAGTSMTIDYKLFKTYSPQRGKNLKIIFKVTNCGNFDAQFLNCVTQEGEREVGLKMRAQDATFSSSGNSIITQYCENSYIEYEFDIYPSIANANGKFRKYLIPWIDGVPVGIKVFDADTFTQSNPSNIVIGSPDCDISIYLFKVYENYIPMQEHLNNFIADASNATDMVSRYNRNNIMRDDANEIDWEKLVDANPNCEVHLYDIPKITTNKKDKVTVNKYQLYKKTTAEPLMYAGADYGKACQIKVQGTSSSAYGIAAFNIDTDFKNGMFDGSGAELSGYQLFEDAVPEKYFNTKVNVASCEGANNALNVEWYNRFQPYKSAAKKKNPNRRDTMKFNPGVMFVLDRNTETNAITNNPAVGDVGDNVFKDTEGYIDDPYYKLYSVCNFGNSKKNFKTLHDLENEYEICIETTDNQNQGQWMVRVEGFDPQLGELDEDGNPKGAFVDLTMAELLDAEGNPNANFELFVNALDDKNFDIRYVNNGDGIKDDDGNIRATNKQILGFFNFVKWMALSDPQPYNELNHPYGYTGEEFTEDTPNAVLNTKTNKYEVTFDSYTFKPKDWKGDSTLLGGLTIQTYRGTYTTDCYEYRMAKMLSECEDHLIMDSIVFHYLFIERHTMIDNVAKNTFWSAEDANSKYWSLIKDYDNDTADGNDNEGRLTLSYGYEATDTVSQDPPVYVFNAYDTVWLHFIMGLYEARKKMYVELDKEHAWDASLYLAAFLDWQNAIPERCWIEDYYRKYIRPYEVYNVTKYFDKLEGGKKTTQRKQYETYQEQYLATKYQTNNIMNTSNSIQFRSNAKLNNQLEGAVPVKVYADCYINTRWGQDESQIRAKRGQTINITPYHTNMNDETDYFFSPGIYSEIGDIGVLVPKTLEFSNANRLQSFEINNASILCSIGLAGSNLLKHLKITNCPSLGSNPGDVGSGTEGITSSGNGQSLDLSDLVSLQDLDITGSNITSLTLPNNAPLTTVSVNKELSQLVANNLNALETLSFENDTNNVTSLLLNNIDNSKVKSLDLTRVNIDRDNFAYGLRNVQWTIDDPNELTLEDGHYDINILDKLLTKGYLRYNLEQKAPNQLETPAEALTGVLKITSNAYDGHDSVNFYNNYVNTEKYPNLDIQFESENAKLITINILNGNGEVVWYRKTNSTAITEENGFLNNGPKGAFAINLIKKSSSEQFEYAFDNQWEIQDMEGNVIDTITDSEMPYYSKVLKTDVQFVPHFIQSNRQWIVRTFDYKGNQVSSQSVDAVITTLEQAVPKTIPYKPEDEDFGLTETYKFLGYAIAANSNTVIDLSTPVNHAYDLYPLFEKSSVYDNVLPESFLTMDNSNMLSVASGCTLKGKITLPNTFGQNKKIVNGISARGFSGQTEITHIFWEDVQSLTFSGIGESAFQNDQKLVYFEMPRTVTSILARAFQNTSLFKNSTDEDIAKFFVNITDIYNNAFSSVLAGNKKLTLSGNLVRLEEACFASAEFTSFQIGESYLRSQLDDSLCGKNIFVKKVFGASRSSFTCYIPISESESDAKWVSIRNKFAIDKENPPMTVSITNL